MGNFFNFHAQPKELRVIYVSDSTSKIRYPLVWSTFAQFLLDIYELFPKSKDIPQTKFLFNDATETSVCICNEITFAALVPRHKQISPTVELYYCVLRSWLV